PVDRLERIVRREQHRVRRAELRRGVAPPELHREHLAARDVAEDLVAEALERLHRVPGVGLDLRREEAQILRGQVPGPVDRLLRAHHAHVVQEQDAADVARTRGWLPPGKRWRHVGHSSGLWRRGGGRAARWAEFARGAGPSYDRAMVRRTLVRLALAGPAAAASSAAVETGPHREGEYGGV